MQDQAGVQRGPGVSASSGAAGSSLPKAEPQIFQSRSPWQCNVWASCVKRVRQRRQSSLRSRPYAARRAFRRKLPLRKLENSGHGGCVQSWLTYNSKILTAWLLSKKCPPCFSTNQKARVPGVGLSVISANRIPRTGWKNNRTSAGQRCYSDEALKWVASPPLEDTDGSVLEVRKTARSVLSWSHSGTLSVTQQESSSLQDVRITLDDGSAWSLKIGQTRQLHRLAVAVPSTSGLQRTVPRWCFQWGGRRWNFWNPVVGSSWVFCVALLQGTLTMPDGAVYEGQFKNGKKHGVAKWAIAAIGSQLLSLSAMFRPSGTRTQTEPSTKVSTRRYLHG